MGWTRALVIALVSATTACGPGGRTACEPGTASSDDECTAVPDASVTEPDADYSGVTFVLRTYRLMIADGQTGVPVVLIATNADGTPLQHGRFALSASRTGAGTFTEPVVMLGGAGGSSGFVPCEAQAVGCLGPLTLSVTPEDAPSIVLAQVETLLVAAQEVGTLDGCLAFESRMHFDGNDYIYNGVLTVEEAEWVADGDDPQTLAFVVVPALPSQGAIWSLEFATRQLGTDLVPGVYEMAQRNGFEADGHPGMDINGDGHGCNVLTGRFQVLEYTRRPDLVESALVSFEQYCDNSTTTMLSGCVYYEH